MLGLVCADTFIKALSELMRRFKKKAPWNELSNLKRPEKHKLHLCVYEAREASVPLC